jgi:hypothetical protein
MKPSPSATHDDTRIVVADLFLEKHDPIRLPSSVSSRLKEVKVRNGSKGSSIAASNPQFRGVKGLL